jgi:hypothetical protein
MCVTSIRMLLATLETSRLSEHYSAFMNDISSMNSSAPRSYLIHFSKIKCNSAKFLRPCARQKLHI